MQNQKRGVNMKEHNATARKIVRAIEKRVRRAGKREALADVQAMVAEKKRPAT